jgi:hypothetical protein
MAAAAAQLAAIAASWGPTVREGLQAARSWLGEATNMFLELPRECRVSLIHAGATCAGTPPKYFPIWGWILIGTALGFILGVAIGWWMRSAREPQWQAIVQEALAVAPPGPGRIILQRLAVGGRVALLRGAADAGLGTPAFLAEVLKHAFPEDSAQLASRSSTSTSAGPLPAALPIATRLRTPNLGSVRPAGNHGAVPIMQPPPGAPPNGTVGRPY